MPRRVIDRFGFDSARARSAVLFFGYGGSVSRWFRSTYGDFSMARRVICYADEARRQYVIEAEFPFVLPIKGV